MPDQGSSRASSSLLPAKEGLSPPDSFSWLCRAAPDLAFLLIALLFLGIFHIVPFPHSQTTIALTCFDLSATEHLQPFIFLLWAQLDKSCLTLVWLAKNTSGYFCGVSVLGRRQSWQQAHAYSWAVGCATALPCFWLAAFCWIHTRSGRSHGILALGDCLWHRPAQLGTNPATWPARLSHHLERHWSWGKLSINPQAKHGVCSALGCLVTAKFHDKNTPAERHLLVRQAGSPAMGCSLPFLFCTTFICRRGSVCCPVSSFAHALGDATCSEGQASISHHCCLLQPALVGASQGADEQLANPHQWARRAVPVQSSLYLYMSLFPWGSLGRKFSPL